MLATKEDMGNKDSYTSSIGLQYCSHRKNKHQMSNIMAIKVHTHIIIIVYGSSTTSLKFHFV